MAADILKLIFVISVDDSFEYAAGVASVLERNGLKGTFFLDTGRVGRALSRATVRRLADFHEVGSHSVTHSHMTMMPLCESLREMRESRRQLEEVIGRNVKSFAFPYGEHSAKLRQLVVFAGYLCARGAREGHYALPGNVYDMNISLHVTPKKLRLLLQSARFTTIFRNSGLDKTFFLLVLGAISVFTALPHFIKVSTGNAGVLHILLHAYDFCESSRLNLLDRFLDLLMDTLQPTNLTVPEVAQLVAADPRTKRCLWQSVVCSNSSDSQLIGPRIYEAHAQQRRTHHGCLV